jgi:endogenous inhibitor of DNA gyrase (YacG/DUF329 family)
MAEIQKNRIHEMRRLGFTYRRIASTVSLIEGTVKSYCLRAEKQGLIPPPYDTASNLCRQCDKEVVQTPKRKRKLFCSKACRQKWWNSHLYLVDRRSKSLHHLVCSGCGKPYTVYGNSKRKYCSHKCYINSRYYQDGNDGQ